MKQILTLIIILNLLTINSCDSQEKQDSLKISDFEFQSILGITTKEPKSNYCLLGTGFLRTPFSDNSDSLINEWFKTHPNASVIPISSIGPIYSQEPDSKIIYCWVIDSKDTLNNYLIRNGCFPGGTMMRPQTWDEMEKWEKELYEDTDEKPDVNVYVGMNVYESFIEQIKSAERFARKNNLGIWRNESDK